MRVEGEETYMTTAKSNSPEDAKHTGREEGPGVIYFLSTRQPLSISSRHI